MTVVNAPNTTPAAQQLPVEHQALSDYLAQAGAAGLWPPAPEDDSAAVMARATLRMTVAAHYPGLEMFYLDRAETALWANQVAEDIVEAHSDNGGLTYQDFINRWWSGPHHDRDLPELATLIINSGAITGDQARTLLSRAWTDPEFPETGADTDDWLDAFGAVGYLSDEDVPAPVTPITLFRGATPIRSKGMAWTANRDTAHWFATRLSTGVGDGCIWTTEAPPNAVLARFVGRGEDEYVLNPYRIRVRRGGQPGR